MTAKRSHKRGRAALRGGALEEDTMRRTTRWITAGAAAVALLLAAPACEPSSASTSTPNNEAENNPTNNETPEAEQRIDPEEFFGAQDGTPPENQRPGDQELDDGDGPTNPELGEDEEELIPVGHLNGSWRVAEDSPDDRPIAYLDLTHDEGAPEATCDWWMLKHGVWPSLGGQGGDCQSTRWDGAAMTTTFNPTSDPSDVWTIQTTEQVDEDTFQGTLTRQNADEEPMPLRITRRNL